MFKLIYFELCIKNKIELNLKSYKNNIIEYIRDDNPS